MTTATATTKKTTVKTVALAEIKPYWRNPRDNRDAVQKVKQSIQDYGYNQLIGVDKNNVIIVGHTRYRALQELGYKEVEVLVLDLDDKKARAYRIVDNKTSEFATWTGDLATELRELDQLSMQGYFKENLGDLMGKSMGVEGLKDITQEQVGKTEAQLASRFASGDVYRKSEKEVVCPECGKQFFISGGG
jgi:hypothetical protein